MTARIFVDEDLSPRIAQLLWNCGVEATCSRDRGLLGWKDRELLPWLASEGWILCTDNGDEWARRMLAWNRAGNDHHGLIIVRQQWGTEAIAAGLSRYLNDNPLESLENQIIYLEEPIPPAPAQ